MRKELLAAVAAGVVLGAAMASMPARAGDYVYADSIGNLIIESAAGYKRIVVGQGYKAKEVQDFTRSSDTDVVYLDAKSDRLATCYRPGLWLKGRSYMYGRSPEDGPYMADCR